SRNELAQAHDRCAGNLRGAWRSLSKRIRLRRRRGLRIRPMQTVSGPVHDRAAKLSERLQLGLTQAVRVRLPDLPVIGPVNHGNGVKNSPRSLSLAASFKNGETPKIVCIVRTTEPCV